MIDKYNNLYRNISYLLFNLLKNDGARMLMQTDHQLRKKIFQQINVLVYLENNFKCHFHHEKLAMPFAQAIANLSQSKVLIKKIHSFDFDQADINVNSLLNFGATFLNCKKEILKAEPARLSQQSINAIQPLSPAKLNSIKAKAQHAIKWSEGQDAKTTHDNQVEARKPPLGKTPTQKQPFDQSGTTNINQNNSLFNNFNTLTNTADAPLHPRFDQRFYPYNKKPKWMKHFKLGLGVWSIGTGVLFLILFILYVAMHPVPVGSYWQWKKEGGLIPLPDKHIDDIDSSNRSQYDLSIRLLMGGAGAGIAAFVPLLGLIPALWLGFHIFSKPKYKRDKYILAIGALVGSALLLAFTLYSIIPILTPDYFHRTFNRYFNPRPLPKADQEYVGSFLWHFGNNVKHIFAQTTMYRVIKSFSIVVLTFVAINLLALLVAIIINPRFDRQKLNFARQEFQKALVAHVRNETYEMDQNLYDPEFDDRPGTEEQNNHDQPQRVKAKKKSGKLWFFHRKAKSKTESNWDEKNNSKK